MKRLSTQKNDCPARLVLVDLNHFYGSINAGDINETFFFVTHNVCKFVYLKLQAHMKPVLFKQSKKKTSEWTRTLWNLIYVNEKTIE